LNEVLEPWNSTFTLAIPNIVERYHLAQFRVFLCQPGQLEIGDAIPFLFDRVVVCERTPVASLECVGVGVSVGCRDVEWVRLRRVYDGVTGRLTAQGLAKPEE
jgi:hypothetical protein